MCIHVTFLRSEVRNALEVNMIKSGKYSMFKVKDVQSRTQKEKEDLFTTDLVSAAAVR